MYTTLPICLLGLTFMTSMSSQCLMKLLWRLHQIQNSTHTSMHGSERKQWHPTRLRKDLFQRMFLLHVTLTWSSCTFCLDGRVVLQTPPFLNMLVNMIWLSRLADIFLLMQGFHFVMHWWHHIVVYAIILRNGHEEIRGIFLKLINW